MKKTVARALWAFTLSSFFLASCSTPKSEPAAVAPSYGHGNAAPSAPPREEASAKKDAEAKASVEDGLAQAEPAAQLRSQPAKAKLKQARAPRGKMVADSPIAGLALKGRDREPQKLAVVSASVARKTEAPSVQNSEDYQDYGKHPMVSTQVDHLSTFAVDVDTASYAISRRKIQSGSMPPTSSVRVEEFLNYFKYDYRSPTDGSPFSVHMDMAPSPFAKNRKLLRVGVQAKTVSLADRKKANLVFLVDVSGSMQSPDKLELAKRALRVLVNNLRDGDTVSLVTYSGNTRVVLPPTGLKYKAKIFSALEDLHASGSTAMASGMTLAYQLAAQGLGPDSMSRVVVLSDGDANIGNVSHVAMMKTIAAKVKEGVTMTTVGFGMGNYKDTRMEQLANKGNGNYFYIDSISQARRVFQEQLGGTLQVVAKDVKIQVDFDPTVVKSYRLIGYENRNVADRDFRNDKVDAGEIGAGHTVTAMYELELLRDDASVATVRLRAKKPKGQRAVETAYTFDMSQSFATFDAAPEDLRFATAVVGAAEILRDSEYATKWTLSKVIDIAKTASTAHAGERAEFVALIEQARTLKNRLARR